MSVILSTRGVNRDFKIGDGSIVSALKNINIEIEQGKLTILRGRSGSGKTTLINILGALDKPTRGNVFFGDRDITKLSERARDNIRRYEMAFVFQSVALMSGMTAYEKRGIATQVPVWGSSRGPAYSACSTIRKVRMLGYSLSVVPANAGDTERSSFRPSVGDTERSAFGLKGSLANPPFAFGLKGSPCEPTSAR